MHSQLYAVMKMPNHNLITKVRAYLWLRAIRKGHVKIIEIDT